MSMTLSCDVSTREMSCSGCGLHKGSVGAAQGEMYASYQNKPFFCISVTLLCISTKLLSLAFVLSKICIGTLNK